MQAMRVHALEGIEALRLESVDSPRPAPDQVRVAVHAAGCNFADTLQLRGLYQTRPPLPFSPGMEVAGEVLEVGAQVEGLEPGMRVMGWVPWGGFAEEALMPGWSTVPIAQGMDWVTAAAFPIAYGTAYGALTQRRVQLQAGETLLVNGAAGGVGLAAVDVGRALGARVVASAGSDEKLAICAEQGATELINHTRHSLREAVKAGVGGVDVVLDPVGGAAFDEAMRCTNRDGRLVVIGFAGGEIQQVPANYLLIKNISVAGFSFSIYASGDPALFRGYFRALNALFEAGKLHPRIDTVLPLADAATALQRLTGRQAVGKVVLQVR